MDSDLTPKQAAILAMIKKNIKQKGYPPSVREIGQAVGLSSSSTVHAYLKKLEAKGYLRRDATKPRAMEVLDDPEGERVEFVNVPLLGKVAAGLPLLAVENREDLFPLPTHFTGAGEFFMLTVRGDSMIEAGIFNGDMVIVRQQHDANNGDVVVALLDEEATVKRFFKEKDRVRLQPENSLMEPIYTSDLKVLGKVIGLVRRIH
ncbi:transcriptional repressor LexA [Pelotomaculum propionicicum]|uniref:LexA repressor n=1 Tax=Pelotomaculum propionicicum TaxID=258475 RepID=A0A4Y7RUT1_9FIRM|nr:transcriptional repressor LexA [Pelotomaculum propionicicum]NLI13737.1 transcriptional repressor LexA [Peptococcaceae bacterium]TEB12530.1 LexA repressor [Pelotomaculum propionicicum]